ncbi:MAG: murein L,D-transpeptidase catalytic domain family protein, partial [Bacteroidetes bacterium]|nr:murein L,D-transpeptidase catalytic domain family protein [Bacteroidota bacterium]
MKNKFCFVSVFGLVTLLLLAPVSQAGNNPKTKTRFPDSRTIVHKSSSEAFYAEVDSLYDQIDLKELGLSQKAFEYAYKGYKYLLKHHLLSNSGVISICDFSQSSRNKRLYVVDLEEKKVLINTYVAHGRKSGGEYARSFSNSLNSHKSSLGFYVTERTYYGDHGLSLKIQGMERGFNDRASRRNIVIHGSEYVGSDFIRMNQFNGR